ncbi:putative ribonuclease H-like domain-containing protein [Tanacetum coccineum]
MNSLISPIRSIGGRSIGAVPLEYHLNYMDMVDYFAKREVEPRQKSIEEQEILPELNFFIKTQYGLQAKRNGGLEQNAFPHKDKAGLGYDSQMNESEVVNNVFNSKESDVDDSPVNDRFKTDDSVYKAKVSEIITIASKTSKDSLEKSKTFRPSAPIIKDWDIDSDNDSVFRPKPDQTKPKFTKINFVKSNENVISVNKENTHRQEEYPRKSQSPRDNRRNWNGMMTQKLGNGFEFIKKSCFVCGSFNHIIKDYDFHDKKIVEKPVLNNKGRVTGQREIRPVWNNAQTASISIARPVNTAAPKSKVNDALPKTYSYFKAHSPVRRAFNQKSAAKTNNLNEKVKTARVNNVTTAVPKAVVSAAVVNGENAIKSSACWIWRPTGNEVLKETECLVLSPNFKLLDESQVLLKVPRQNNMYSFDLKNVVPSGGLTCLFAKATIDESNLWHRRLDHINFKTMNKLVRGNLVRGLPLKLFENDHTCVACQKGSSTKLLLCGVKGIKREFSVARTPQQNRVGERKNRTLIEAARTMLVDSLLPTTFWAEAVSTACYVQNKELKRAVVDDAGKKTNEEPANKAKLDNLLIQQKEDYANSTNRDSTISPSVNTDGQNFTNADDLPLIPDLEDTGIFSGAYDDEDVGAEADLNNLETTMNVSPIPTTRIHKDHPKDQIIVENKEMAMQDELLEFSMQSNKARLVAQGYTQEERSDYDEVFAHVARIEAIRLFLAYASFMRFIVYLMDVKSAFLYATIEEEAPRAWYETLSTYLLENGYRRGTLDKTLFIKKDRGDILLVQVYVNDIIFRSTKKSLCVEFEQMIHKRFQMSSMRELTFFLGLQDEEAEDVDVHLYRSIIESLMYLTASRPDIMFDVCACARFQVTPKVPHLHAVKGIFRYLKDETVIKEWKDRMERVATTASSLEAEQDSGNINRTQSMATLNESFPQGTDLGSGPRCQDTILRGAKAQIRFEAASKQSNDPPLLRVNTLGSGEDSMKLKELIEFCTKIV